MLARAPRLSLPAVALRPPRLGPAFHPVAAFAAASSSSKPRTLISGPLGNWTKTLLDAAEATNSADRIANELTALKSFFKKTKPRVADLRPTVSKSSLLVQKLFEFLIAKNRLSALPSLTRNYLQLLADKRHVSFCTATVPAALSEAQAARLKDALKQRVGSQRNLVLNVNVDPGIVGGVVVFLDGKRFDLSIRSMIDRHRAQLAAPKNYRQALMQ